MNFVRVEKLTDTIKNLSPDTEAYREACRQLNDEMSGGHLALLKNIVEEGPIHLDHINKNDQVYRLNLVEFGLVARICVKSQQDYYAATEDGWNVWKAIDRSTDFDG